MLSTVLVLYRIIDPPADCAAREFGVFLGLIAAAAVAFGGWLAMQEEGDLFGDEAGRFGGGGDAGTRRSAPSATALEPSTAATPSVRRPRPSAEREERSRNGRVWTDGRLRAAVVRA